MSGKPEKKKEATAEENAAFEVYAVKVMDEIKKHKMGQISLTASTVLGGDNPFGTAWVRYLSAAIDNDVDPATAALAFIPMLWMGAQYYTLETETDH